MAAEAAADGLRTLVGPRHSERVPFARSRLASANSATEHASFTTNRASSAVTPVGRVLPCPVPCRFLSELTCSAIVHALWRTALMWFAPGVSPATCCGRIPSRSLAKCQSWAKSALGWMGQSSSERTNFATASSRSLADPNARAGSSSACCRRFSCSFSAGRPPVSKLTDTSASSPESERVQPCFRNAACARPRLSPGIEPSSKCPPTRRSRSS